MNITIKKTKTFWCYILLGLITIVLGLMLAPFWEKVDPNLFFARWGITVVSYAMAAGIMCYVIFYLFKKLKKSSNTVQMLILIEIVLMILIALSLIISTIDALGILPNEPVIIVGIAFFIRGFIEIVRAYYVMKAYTASNNVKIYPLYKVVLNILLITAGCLFMFNDGLNNVTTSRPFLAWVIAISLMFMGILLIAYGFIAMPEKKKSSKRKETKKEN